MTDAICANENEIFTELMDEFIVHYGNGLLKKNEELQSSGAELFSALSYVRCREHIRRELAALRRAALMKTVRISSAVVCALLVLAAGSVLLVPSLRDAVIGRTETVPSVILSEEDGYRPSFRRNLPPIITPEPEETDDPTASTHQIMSKDYEFDLDTYLAEQEAKWAEENRRYRETHTAQNNQLIVNGRIYNGYDISSSPLAPGRDVNTYGMRIDGYYPDMTPPGPTSAINVQPNTGRRSDRSYNDLPPGTYVIGDKVVIKWA